jgi:hypothetical protein
VCRGHVDGVPERAVDGHVGTCMAQLLQDVQAAWVLGMGSDRRAGAAGGMRPELVQGDGLYGFRAEPEEEFSVAARVFARILTALSLLPVASQVPSGMKSARGAVPVFRPTRFPGAASRTGHATWHRTRLSTSPEGARGGCPHPSVGQGVGIATPW